MVCGDSCCSGPGHPEQRSEHEGAVAGTSRGGRVEGRPAEGLGGPLGLGADSFVLHANHAARGAGNSAGRTPPPRPPTGKGRGRHAGHPGRSDPGRGHRWQAGSPAHPDQSGTSLLGGGSEGRKGCTDWTCLALGRASAHSALVFIKAGRRGLRPGLQPASERQARHHHRPRRCHEAMPTTRATASPADPGQGRLLPVRTPLRQGWLRLPPLPGSGFAAVSSCNTPHNFPEDSLPAFHKLGQTTASAQRAPE